jgi:hypothetical protein
MFLPFYEKQQQFLAILVDFLSSFMFQITVRVIHFSPRFVCQACSNSFHVLLDLRPVDGQYELVLRILPDETEQHHRQRDVLRVHGRLQLDVLDRDLETKIVKRFYSNDSKCFHVFYHELLIYYLKP